MGCALHRDTAVLLVDAQTYFLERMHGAKEPVLARLERLLMLCDMLDLPVIATLEEPVETKGGLPERLQSAMPAGARCFVKASFDSLADEPVRTALAGLGRRHVAVAGAETDVCVLQSVLALLATDYRVFLLEDCLFSSEADPRPTLERMVRAGAAPCTFKTLAYELTGTVDSRRWPGAWRERSHLFPPPEELPPR
ncbi:MAG: isochorismatase family protein [Planctomycetota bacterium]